ncbi:MAG: GrpB family protein [bacterium]
MKIILADHDPEWKNKFHIDKKILIDVLSDIKVKIEHTGSTSVEGLCAKPIIDILIGVENISLIDQKQTEKMIRSGYNYIDKFEDVLKIISNTTIPAKMKIL